MIKLRKNEIDRFSDVYDRIKLEYCTLFNIIPSSIYCDSTSASTQLIKQALIDLGFTVEYTSGVDFDKLHMWVLVHRREKILVHLHRDTHILHPTGSQFIYKIVNILNKFSVKKEEDTQRVYLLISDSSSFTSKSCDLGKSNMDIELNYSTSILPVHEKILAKLSSSSPMGITLLHGKPGTGKTSYIKHLTTLLPDKKFLIIPNYLIGQISSPQFINFLIEEEEGYILVLEDAEEAISSREHSNTSSNSVVSEILNISDGIIGAAIKCSIIATFNMDIQNIDKALQRKGRLIAEHHFDDLPIADANKLLKHLGKEEVATKAMSLADIYNIDEKDYKIEKKRTTIGFGS